MTILRKLLEPAISHPEYLDIRITPAGPMECASIAVHGADYARICGKGGRNLATLKTLLSISDPDLRIVLEKPLTDDRSAYMPSDPEWKPDAVLRMMADWLEYAEFAGVTVAATPSRSGGFNVFITDRIDPDVINALARWAVVVSNAQGGRIHVEGATHSAA